MNDKQKTVIMTLDEYAELPPDHRRTVQTECETLSKGREVLTKDGWLGVVLI